VFPQYLQTDAGFVVRVTTIESGKILSSSITY